MTGPLKPFSVQNICFTGFTGVAAITYCLVVCALETRSTQVTLTTPGCVAYTFSAWGL